jgi:hypothetical protein
MNQNYVYMQKDYQDRIELMQDKQRNDDSNLHTVIKD